MGGAKLARGMIIPKGGAGPTAIVEQAGGLEVGLGKSLELQGSHGCEDSSRSTLQPMYTSLSTRNAVA